MWGKRSEWIWAIEARFGTSVWEKSEKIHQTGVAFLFAWIVWSTLSAAVVQVWISYWLPHKTAAAFKVDQACWARILRWRWKNCGWWWKGGSKKREIKRVNWQNLVPKWKRRRFLVFQWGVMSGINLAGEIWNRCVVLMLWGAGGLQVSEPFCVFTVFSGSVVGALLSEFDIVLL